MKTIKVFGFKQTAPNQFTFTGQELEKLLNQVYKEGYEDGVTPKGNPIRLPVWNDTFTDMTDIATSPCSTAIKYENPSQTLNWARDNLTNGDVKCE